MIPKTYYDGNPEDRAYVDDFWSWLKEQPQDAWLLWARTANWDNAEPIFSAMLDDSACDLALVSWLFWTADPSFLVDNPGRYSAEDLVGKIVSNLERGHYVARGLFYDRYEVAIHAQEYVGALRRRGAAPFRLPRVLCGPFTGRRAALPAAYDTQTEQDLEEIFDLMDGALPRSEDEHWRRQTEGGNLWIRDRLKLPNAPSDPVAAFSTLDDAAYVEAIFGQHADYRAARTPQKKKWWPFG